jgi:opacity protein-like surface antigen
MNGSKTFVLAAGVWALASSVAFAADMPLLERAPVIEEFGGWYLRGDIGMTNQQLGRQYNPDMATAPGFVFLDEGGFDSGMLYGLGVGYQFNSWLRTDFTGEYRGKTSFHSIDRYNLAGGGFGGTNDYTADKSEWLFLANAYVDLGTWCHVTPFIGVGLGMAQVNISNYRDINVWAPESAFAADESQWNFAWALHAGLAYQVTPGFTVELAYRYVSLGDGKSGDVIAAGGANARYNPTTFEDITSHDVKLGVRWLLGANDVPPVVRKY